MDLIDLVLGKPLATEDEKAERIGPVKGIPIFGLDALSSAAYGPEAAMTLLIPLGMAGIAYILPIVGAILVLLTIVYFSYRQTMQAYPHGGGSYTVATENLGTGAGPVLRRPNPAARKHAPPHPCRLEDAAAGGHALRLGRSPVRRRFR